MSDADVRRPRRIIPAEAAPVPPAQPAAPGTPLPPLLRQAERFQRSLWQPAGQRSAAATMSKAAVSAPTAPAAPQPTSTAAPSPRATAARTACAAPPPATREASAPLPPMPSVPQEMPASHGNGDAPEDTWAQDLAQVVATLCRQSDPAFEAWSIVVPLDPLVLPETELRLALSRHRLSLRFHTQSPQSLHLVLSHRASLAALIEQAMPSTRDIDIDVT